MKASEKNLRDRKSKKLDSKAKGTLELLLIVGIILIIPLFFVVRSQASPQSLDATPTAMMEWATTTPAGAGESMEATPNAPLPTEEPLTAQGVQPPACTFPLAQTTTEESTSEEYTFSEPQKVSVGSSSGNIDLYQWLPDNQRVLIGRQREENSMTGYTIELLNPQTGEVQLFGARPWPSMNVPPVWVPGLDAVIYSTTITPDSANPPLVRDSNGMPVIPPTRNYGRQLWVSKGDSADVQSIVDELVTVSNKHRPTVGSEFIVAVNPDGSEIVYMDNVGSKLYVRKVTRGALQTVSVPSFDAAKWDYRRPGDTPFPIDFQMAWRPNSSQIFLYNDIQAAGYTFLLDIKKGEVCELNLFGTEDPNEWRKSWAMLARWSPNGRYLAVVRTKGDRPIEFSDLIILDAVTGNLYQTDVTKFSPSDLDIQGRHYIIDVAWAPDNQHLSVIGYVNSAGSNTIPDLHRLFLLDFLTGKAIQISSANFGRNMDINLLWSNDGSQLLVKCPGGLCLLSVQKTIEP